MEEFIRGYFCAVAMLIEMEGCVDANIKNLFRSISCSFDDLGRIIDKRDFDILNKYRSLLG